MKKYILPSLNMTNREISKVWVPAHYLQFYFELTFI